MFTLARSPLRVRNQKQEKLPLNSLLIGYQKAAGKQVKYQENKSGSPSTQSVLMSSIWSSPYRYNHQCENSHNFSNATLPYFPFKVIVVNKKWTISLKNSMSTTGIKQYSKNKLFKLFIQYTAIMTKLLHNTVINIYLTMYN